MRLSLQDEKIHRSRFIMGISHDLRTPIALIKGYAEAISDGMVDDVAMREKSVEIIINNKTTVDIKPVNIFVTLLTK